jgi:hypothetical protein
VAQVFAVELLGDFDQPRKGEVSNSYPVFKKLLFPIATRPFSILGGYNLLYPIL